MNISISYCFIFIFIPLSKAKTFVKIEPNGGNITICQDKITDLEYKVSSESIIGQFYQTLKPETWHNCDDCQIWYLNDTRQSQLLYSTKSLESLIPINRSIIENYAKQNIDKDLPIRRLLMFPERSKTISYYHGTCYFIGANEYSTCNNIILASEYRFRFLEDADLYCIADLGKNTIALGETNLMKVKCKYCDILQIMLFTHHPICGKQQHFQLPFTNCPLPIVLIHYQLQIANKHLISIFIQAGLHRTQFLFNIVFMT